MKLEISWDVLKLLKALHKYGDISLCRLYCLFLKFILTSGVGLHLFAMLIKSYCYKPL